jgi:S1-C subfamily serine protease
MKKLMSLVLCTLFTVVGCTQYNEKSLHHTLNITFDRNNVESVASSLEDSTVYLSNDLCHGTGFVIKQINGYSYILTDRHVVTDAEVIKDNKLMRVFVPSKNGIVMSKFYIGDAEVLALSNPTLDLALLKIKYKSKGDLRLEDSKLPSVGSKVFSYGNPMFLDFVFTQGVIGQYNHHDEYTDIITDCHIGAGMSGAALVTENSKVIGIVQRIPMNDEMHNCSTSSFDIIKWLKANKFEYLLK